MEEAPQEGAAIQESPPSETQSPAVGSGENTTEKVGEEEEEQLNRSNQQEEEENKEPESEESPHSNREQDIAKIIPEDPIPNSRMPAGSFQTILNENMQLMVPEDELDSENTQQQQKSDEGSHEEEETEEKQKEENTTEEKEETADEEVNEITNSKEISEENELQEQTEEKNPESSEQQEQTDDEGEEVNSEELNKTPTLEDETPTPTNENENENEKGKVEEAASNKPTKTKYDGPIESTVQSLTLTQDINLAELPPLETNPEVDQKCQKMIRHFQEKGKLPDPEKMPMVMQYLSRQIANAISRGKYSDAHDNQEIQRRLISNSIVAKSDDFIETKTNDLSDKLESIEKEIQNIEQTHEREKKLMEKKHDQLRENLIKQHETELSELEDKWNDSQFLKKFEKPSSQLLELSKVEHAYIVTKMYDRAEEIKAQVAQLEEAESTKAQERALVEMERDRNRLTKEQARDAAILEDVLTKECGIFEADFERRLELANVRKERLEAQISEMKDPKRTKLPPLKTRASVSAESAVTPRTAQRLVLCKTAVRNPKLTVKPLGSIKGTKKKKVVPKPDF